MSELLRGAARVGSALRELTRMHYRDDIQHARNRDALAFMRLPARTIRAEVATVLDRANPEEDVARFVLQQISAAFNIRGIMDRVPAYNNLPPENLIGKELRDRQSNMPIRIATVMGDDSVPTSKDSDAAYDLGKKLAQAGTIAVCYTTRGILLPFLKGMIDHGGLTVGILSRKQTETHADHLSTKDGLIRLPIVAPYGEGALRTTIASMSGRMILVLNGLKDRASLRCAMDAAYGGTPVVFVGKDRNLPIPMRHPLQSFTSWERAFDTIDERLFLRDPEDAVEEAYQYLNSPRTPISVLASTKSKAGKNISRAKTAQIEKLVEGLAKEGCYTITGAGPGDMAIVARIARQYKALAVGIAFFRTYLAINPYIDVPIVGNLKMERSDIMALSSVATINLGGSHATADEIVSALQFRKPVINCVRTFDTPFFGRLRKRGAPPIVSATTPEETLLLLRKLIS